MDFCNKSCRCAGLTAAVSCNFTPRGCIVCKTAVDVLLIRESFGKVEAAIEIAEEFDIQPAAEHNNYRELTDHTMAAVHDGLNVIYHLLVVKLRELDVNVKDVHARFPMPDELAARQN